MKRVVWSLLAGAVLHSAQAQMASTDLPALRLSTQLARAPVDAGAGEDLADSTWTRQAEQWLPGSPACAAHAQPDWQRLSLETALAHHLCKNPELRQALAEVAEQTAGLDLARQTGRPRWNASADFSTSRNFNSSGSSGRTASATLGLTWVLFDFGQRSANLISARQTLTAALARQDTALLDSVQNLMDRYEDAVVAQVALEATTEAETTATQTEAAAQARYDAKVGSQIDRLQAQTALAQSTLERVRARSQWENARGNLALSLGADITQDLKLTDWERWTRPNIGLPELSRLREEALQTHPRLRSVMAQIDSLKARLDATKAEGRGSVSVSASGGSSRNWGAAGTGNIPTGNAAIVVSLPLFNGKETQAQLSQALAQIDSLEAEYERLRRETESQLWQAHHALLTSRQSLQASERLLVSAENTYRVAQGRYRSGVGSMLDLLTAQSAVADARRQRVAAQVEQLAAQTQLSLASGRVGR